MSAPDRPLRPTSAGTVPAPREQSWHQRFEAAIESLTAPPDSGVTVSDLLGRLVCSCVSVFDIDTAVAKLADEDGSLGTEIACSKARVDGGPVSPRDHSPGAGCFQRGATASKDPNSGRWPGHSARARPRGLHAVQVLPLRAHEQVVGSVILARKSPGALPAADVALAQSFASMATLSLLQRRTERSHAQVRDQLQQALDSRVLIEQAKGYVARSLNESPDEAFQRLRRHARSRSMRLTAVAADVLADRLTLT